MLDHTGTVWATNGAGTISRRGAHGWDNLVAPAETLAVKGDGSLWRGKAAGIFVLQGDVATDLPIFIKQGLNLQSGLRNVLRLHWERFDRLWIYDGHDDAVDILCAKAVSGFGLAVVTQVTRLRPSFTQGPAVDAEGNLWFASSAWGNTVLKLKSGE